MSYAFRKDNRSDVQFATSIDKSTALERRLFRQWCLDVVECGLFENVVYEDNGVDNSGAVIKSDDPRMNEPDFIATFTPGIMRLEGVHKVECKYDPVFYKATYKENNLKSYIEHDALMLTVFGDGPNPKYWTLIGPSQIKTITSAFTVRPYREVGGKDGYQLLRKPGDFDKYFSDFYVWGGSAVPLPNADAMQ